MSLSVSSLYLCSEVSAIDTEHFRILFRGNIYNITFVNVQYKNKTLKIRSGATGKEVRRWQRRTTVDGLADAIMDGLK